MLLPKLLYLLIWVSVSFFYAPTIKKKKTKTKQSLWKPIWNSLFSSFLVGQWRDHNDPVGSHQNERKWTSVENILEYSFHHSNLA